MSFFSWGSQQRTADLPTQGQEEEEESPSAQQQQLYHDEPEEYQEPVAEPLSASGPPPTTLAYSPSSEAPPMNSTFYNHPAETSATSEQQHEGESPATQTTMTDNNIHVFVPQAPDEEVYNDDDDDNKGEVDSWDETWPNETEPPTMEDPTSVSPMASTDAARQVMTEPYQNPATSMAQHEYKTSHEGWEDIEPVTSDISGPATLETVPDRPTTSPTEGEFEWIASPPSDDDPSILVETRDTVAIRSPQNDQTSATSLSTALVIPRGLPPFTQGVQTGLTQLQEQSARRAHEVRTRIHAVELKMAQWTADLAQERMARQEALQDVLAESVYGPAGELVDRVARSRQKAENQINRVEEKTGDSVEEENDDDSTQRLPRWRTVETRLTALETRMSQSTHSLAKQQREKLLSLHDRLIYEVMPKIWQERTAAEARESFLLERIDEMAGEFAARSAKVCAERQVAVTTLDEDLQTEEESYEDRHKALGEAMVAIRAELEQEQELRQLRDLEIRQQMEAMAAALSSAMLEAVGDPQD